MFLSKLINYIDIKLSYIIHELCKDNKLKLLTYNIYYYSDQYGCFQYIYKYSCI